MPSTQQIMDGLQEALDALEELKEAADDIQEVADKLDEIEDLMERIERARSDPDALDDTKYGDLLADMILLLPGGGLLPEPLREFLSQVLRLIGLLFDAATKWVLEILRRRHKRLTDGYGGDEEAAKRAAKVLAPYGQHYLWLLAKWKEGQHEQEAGEGEGEDEPPPATDPDDLGDPSEFPPMPVPEDGDRFSTFDFLFALMRLIEQTQERLRDESIDREERERLEAWMDKLLALLKHVIRVALEDF